MKLLSGIFLVLLACCLLAGCGPKQEAEVPPTAPFPDAQAPLSVVDDTGASVPIPARAERIISLAPSCTELLYALGLGDQIIAVSESSDYPPEAKEKAQLGVINLNYEQIVSLKPDLIVGINSLQPTGIAHLRKLGLPVLALEPSKFEDVVGNIGTLGIATGKGEEAEKLTREMLGVIEAVRKQAKPMDLKVFVEISMEPLYAAAADTFVGQMLTDCGAKNAVPAEYKGFAALSEEALLAGEPDLIITTSPDAQQLLATSKWRQLKAVKAWQGESCLARFTVAPWPASWGGVEGALQTCPGPRARTGRLNCLQSDSRPLNAPPAWRIPPPASR